MNFSRYRLLFAATALLGTALGCASSNVQLATLERPDRAEELAAYDVFVGDWDWQADVVGGDGADQHWTGTAKWKWTLDNRALRGSMSSRSGDTSFDAEGLWSWHPKRKKYVWTMFNSWGYPQEGSAQYDESKQHWVMPYTSVGLDGTTSYGEYEMTVVGQDTLEWHMIEWADPFHLGKKIEMTGSYTRR